MALLKQSTSYNRAFLIVSTADHISGLTGQTPVITLYKGASTSSSSSTGTIAEMGNGWYRAALTSNDTATLGDLAIHATSTAGDVTDWIDQVVAVDLTDSVRLGLTALPNATAGSTGGLWILGTNSTSTITHGPITSTGTWTIPSISSTGTVSIINLTSTGTVTVNNLTSTGTFTIPNVSSTGTVNIVTLTSTGSVALRTITSTGAWTVQGGIVADITGNLSGSVGSVTGAVGSVTGAVGSVTGAVGSVTGNVGGNVVGSVGSVVGAVGSVTGNVGGNVVGSVASVTAAVTVGTNNDKTGYSLAAGGIGSGVIAAAELNNIADAHLDRNMAAGVDSGTNSTAVRTPRQAYRMLRNKTTVVATSTSAGNVTVTKEDDATTSWSGAVSFAANDPLTSVDPA